MGGNNPLIVEDPDDIDAAVHLAIQSAFVTAGQRCTCARRLLVKRGAQGDAFLARLVEVSARLKPDTWDAEPQPFIGGLISEQAAQNVVNAWRDHVARGGKKSARADANPARHVATDARDCGNECGERCAG